MGKWRGNGVPPTRRKLHRVREAQRRERAADQAQKAADEREWDRQARKLKLDHMLTERDLRKE